MKRPGRSVSPRYLSSCIRPSNVCRTCRDSTFFETQVSRYLAKLLTYFCELAFEVARTKVVAARGFSTFVIRDFRCATVNSVGCMRLRLACPLGVPIKPSQYSPVTVATAARTLRKNQQLLRVATNKMGLPFVKSCAAGIATRVTARCLNSSLAAGKSHAKAQRRKATAG